MAEQTVNDVFIDVTIDTIRMMIERHDRNPAAYTVDEMLFDIRKSLSIMAGIVEADAGIRHITRVFERCAKEA